MLISEQIDTLAASVPKMTITRAEHFCDLYEALYIVYCDLNNDVLINKLEARMQEIRELKNSIADYKIGKAISLSKVLKILGKK